MLWRPHRNYLQTTLNCHEINVNFNIVVALLFVSIMMLNQHTVGPSTLFLFFRVLLFLALCEAYSCVFLCSVHSCVCPVT